MAAAIDTVVAMRQFEISGRGVAPLGRSTNYPRSVAGRVGVSPTGAVLEPIGGQGPQHAITEFAGSLAAGEADAVLVFGSENGCTLRYFADRAEKPDHTENVSGELTDRGFGYEGLFDGYTVAHGLVGAPAQYGLLENARRARVGLGVAEYRRAMAELFAPSTKGAAHNPFSASPVARSVYLRGHADLADQPLLDRADLSVNSASILAVREALAVAGIGIDDISTFDLYSCFPVPVFNFCDGMELATNVPRGLTLTGGLPYFGGPGNNYSLHTIAETVARMRAAPGAFGLVAANGGIISKYSVGVYSTEPGEWAPDTGDPAGPGRRHRGDLHGPLRLAGSHRHHRRSPDFRRQPVSGPGRRPGPGGTAQRGRPVGGHCPGVADRAGQPGRAGLTAYRRQFIAESFPASRST